MQSSYLKWLKNLIYGPDSEDIMLTSSAKIVAIGGGTGLSTLLRGLKNYFYNLTAIVTMTDDGTSSGIISREFDTLPPGDIRKCISALARDENLVSKLLEYRFPKDNKSFSGHTLGNIWIAALTRHFESFEKAIETTSEIFAAQGKILPATLDSVRIGAIYSDKKKIIGESKIPRPGEVIEKIFLTKNPLAYEKALQAIKSADFIIIGPGSLYTSIIPNLLIKRISQTIKTNRKAPKVYIANCSSERGETEGMTIEDHIKEIEKIAGKNLFDYCLVNNNIIKTSRNSSKLGAVNNITTENKIFGKCKIIKADLIDENNPIAHDSEKLAQEIANLFEASN